MQIIEIEVYRSAKSAAPIGRLIEELPKIVSQELGGFLKPSNVEIHFVHGDIHDVTDYDIKIRIKVPYGVLSFENIMGDRRSRISMRISKLLHRQIKFHVMMQLSNSSSEDGRGSLKLDK